MSGMEYMERDRGRTRVILLPGAREGYAVGSDRVRDVC